MLSLSTWGDDVGEEGVTWLLRRRCFLYPLNHQQTRSSFSVNHEFTVRMGVCPAFLQTLSWPVLSTFPSLWRELYHHCSWSPECLLPCACVTCPAFPLLCGQGELHPLHRILCSLPWGREKIQTPEFSSGRFIFTCIIHLKINRLCSSWTIPWRQSSAQRIDPKHFRETFFFVVVSSLKLSFSPLLVETQKPDENLGDAMLYIQNKVVSSLKM